MALESPLFQFTVFSPSKDGYKTLPAKRDWEQVQKDFYADGITSDKAMAAAWTSLITFHDQDLINILLGLAVALDAGVNVKQDIEEPAAIEAVLQEAGKSKLLSDALTSLGQFKNPEALKKAILFFFDQYNFPTKK